MGCFIPRNQLPFTLHSRLLHETGTGTETETETKDPSSLFPVKKWGPNSRFSREGNRQSIYARASS
ncbi:Ff.00g097930.m01.CDS01 [Fusarium sp. VM40]|nr:Ff.00g097930.m01.CDS01 [Fusarium sp. VM40]